MTVRTARPYADPYLAGIALGLVLLACFALTGRGLGASGAFASVASGVVGAIAPHRVAGNNYFQSYLQAGAPWTAWIVMEVLGVVVGAALSALLYRRAATFAGRGAVPARRLVAAAGGGVLMGAGAALARGCTSGLALSGGALLGVGSWIFMLALFAAGFAAAPLLRKLWA
ncbi:MAG: hypothetical protein JWM65_150 [Sphingomonas bacterium]|nr:hypothetical protein [Sphingomonas bacterium]